jgi:hypothetical protein
VKAWNKCRGKFEHECVDDQPEYSQGGYGERQCNDFKKKPECGVYQADYEYGNQCGSHSFHEKAWNNARGNPNGQRIYHPMKEQSQHIENLWPMSRRDWISIPSKVLAYCTIFIGAHQLPVGATGQHRSFDIGTLRRSPGYSNHAVFSIFAFAEV